jgi:hypothetical protein
MGEKPSAPSNAPVESARDVFASSACLGVSDDMQASDGIDRNARQASAFLKVATELGGEARVADIQKTLHVTHGAMMTQATPLYMMLLYPFYFPNGTGCPDVYGHPHRDKTEKPEVDVGNHWSKIIMQRAEGQHRRDLTFPHANWQWVFKSTINLGASLLDTVRAASQTDADGSSKYDISDFSAAANEIVEGLRGHYLTPGGVRKEVKGDMQHLHSLDPPLSSLAKTFLRSFQATNRNIEGTQEIRTMMRKDGEAFAVMYGGNVFITISPNERQNALMIRCARSLRSDPMRKYDDDFAKWTNIDTPSLEIKHHASLDDERTVNVPIQAILGALPDMQSQQALLAKDPLASVYGFHILVRITLRALFGVRICSDCTINSLLGVHMGLVCRQATMHTHST